MLKVRRYTAMPVAQWVGVTWLPAAWCHSTRCRTALGSNVGGRVATQDQCLVCSKGQIGFTNRAVMTATRCWQTVLMRSLSFGAAFNWLGLRIRFRLPAQTYCEFKTVWLNSVSGFHKNNAAVSLDYMQMCLFCSCMTLLRKSQRKSASKSSDVIIKLNLGVQRGAIKIQLHSPAQSEAATCLYLCGRVK